MTCLCGDCLPGYSHTINGYDCVADKDCGRVGWFVTGELLYYLCFVAYALYQARHPPLLALLPRRFQPGAFNSGQVSALVFFFQLAAYAVPRGSSG